MSGDHCAEKCGGLSLVFLHDPSRLKVNERTKENLIKQRLDNCHELLQCFYCHEGLVDRDDICAVETTVTRRITFSFLRSPKKAAHTWQTCPCCCSVTCKSCLCCTVLEGSSGQLLDICLHCFTNSSRVRHPPAGHRVGSYHTTNKRAFQYMWEGFKHNHKKIYPNAEEETRRSGIFANNLLRIDVLNENSSLSCRSLAGINRYTDLTGSEYNEFVLTRSRLASDLLLVACHESCSELLDMKKNLSELILKNDFQQFTDIEIDKVIANIQSLVSSRGNHNSNSSSNGDVAVNVQELEDFCEQALETMRKIIPKNIFYASEKLLMEEKKYSPDLAAHLMQTKCLWLIVLETADLHQISIEDLMGRYAVPPNLDLVESAALLSVLPKTFLKGDIDGDKRSWRKALTVRVAQLYKHQCLGTLKPDLMRNAVYSQHICKASSNAHTDSALDFDDGNCNTVAEYASTLSSNGSSSNSASNEKYLQKACTQYDLMPDKVKPDWASAKCTEGDKCDYDVMPSKKLPLPTPPAHGSSALKYSTESVWPSSVKVILDSELIVGEFIGKGSFGIVRRGSWRGMDVALKSFRLQPSEKSIENGDGSNVDSLDSIEGEIERNWRDFQQEINRMVLVCHHANIVQLIGVLEDSSSLSPCIVTVFYEHGSLYDKLIKPHRKNSPGGITLLHKSHLMQWALEAAQGVYHLHQEGLIHRDLATRNLLLDDTLHVRVCDFGFSRVKDREASRGLTKSDLGPIKWTSPEAMRERSYSTFSDVFSFGVVLYELFVQREPWVGQDAIEVVLTVCAGMRMDIPDHVDPAIAGLMQLCWDHDPLCRPRFDEIIRVLKELVCHKKVGSIS